MSDFWHRTDAELDAELFAAEDAIIARYEHWRSKGKSVTDAERMASQEMELKRLLDDDSEDVL